MKPRTALLLTLALTCAPMAAGAQGSPSSAGAVAAALAEVNAFRASKGVAPLTLDAKLVAAAKGHAADMARYRYLGHTSRDGRSFVQRIVAAGYTGWTALGENIAMGQKDWHAAFLAWRNSPGHRANMLSPKFKDIGLGAATDANGRRYWVQDFGTRRTSSAATRSTPSGPSTGTIGSPAAIEAR